MNKGTNQALFLFVMTLFGAMELSWAQDGATPGSESISFSVSCNEMTQVPDAAELIVDAEVRKGPAVQAKDEMRARNCLGSGFQARGDFLSAQKNFQKCIALNTKEIRDPSILPACMVGLAQVSKYSLRDLPVLNELFGSRALAASDHEKYIALYFSLIDGFTLSKAYSKAEQLVSELKKDGLLPGDKSNRIFLEVLEGRLLTYKRDFTGAKAKFLMARQDASKLGLDRSGVDAAVSVAESDYFIAKKEYERNKVLFTYGSETSLAQSPDFDLRIRECLQGMMVGFYIQGREAVNRYARLCKGTVANTELEKEFFDLFEAWRLLSESKDNSKEMKDLVAVLGPNHVWIDALHAASRWKGKLKP